MEVETEEVEKSERELRRMEILAKHGVTPEMLEENKRKAEESQMNKTAQELQQAIQDALARQERLIERKLTDQERALVESEVQDSFRQRAEESLAKGNPTGS